jgi:hypothetical protein
MKTIIRSLLDLGWAITDSLIDFLDQHDPQTTVTRSRIEGDSQNG